MRTKRLNFVTILCAFFAAAFLSVGVVMASPVKAADVTNAENQVVFVMDEGASIRVGTDDSTYGVKFTATMSDADYTKLMGKVGEGKEYASASFGMLIAPATYSSVYGALNYDNVFGDSAIYKWRTFDTETGVWNPYEPESGKTQIINIYGQKLYEVTPVEGEKYWAFQGGAVTKVSSMLLKYEGVGYVELVKADGSADYVFAVANDNVRTAYEVAAKALSDANSELTESEIQWIEENYISSEEAVFEAGLTSADTLDLAKLGVPAGEYDITIQQYINKTYTENKVVSPTLVKDYVGEAVPATVDGTVVDISGLEGTYSIFAKYAGTNYGYTINVDHYTPGTFVWNNVNDVTESTHISDAWGQGGYRPSQMTELSYVADKTGTPAEGRDGAYYKATFASYFAAANDGIDGFGAKIYPVHSKEYYSTLFAGKSVQLDYYYSKNGETPDIYWQFVVGYGLGNSAGYLDFKMPADSWEGSVKASEATSSNDWLTRKSFTISQLVDNWSALLFAGGQSDGGHGTMIGLRNAVNKGDGIETTETCEGPITFYFGNVHLTNSNMYYTETAYDLDGNVITSTTKSAALGSTVTYVPAIMDGYSYVASNANNVLTGTLTGNNTLELKAYYASVTTSTIDGIITDAMLDFSSYLSSDIVKYTVSQYIVRGDGNKGVDVTADFATDLANGTSIDVSGFDGIFTVTAFDSEGNGHSITFERMILGQFVWNNVHETTTAYGASFGGIWAGATSGPAKGVTAVATDDPAVAGRDGYYYTFDSSYAEIYDKFGMKVYPSHSKAYYESFVASGYDLKLIMDYKIVMTDSNATNYPGSWNFMTGYGVGGSTDWAYVCRKTNDDWWSIRGANVVNLDSSVQTLSLIKIIAGWDGLMKVNNGYTFATPRNSNTAYQGDVTVYFGNVWLYNDFTYTNEYYKYDASTGEYVIDDTLTETATADPGATVNFNVKDIDGYVYKADYAGNVSSAVLVGNGTLVLKGYYVPATVEDISVDESGNAILRKDATLDFGIGAVKSYTVTQYAVKDSGNVGVDVTDDYANLFDANGVADTSRLDGIYTISAVGETGAKIITLEQYKEGVFTWNNIDESGHDTVVGATIKGTWSRDAYKGTGKISVETAETDPMLAGRPGLYWKVSGIGTTSGDNYGVGVRVFPVHSEVYYNLYTGAQIYGYSYYIDSPGGAEYVDKNGATQIRKSTMVYPAAYLHSNAYNTISHEAYFNTWYNSCYFNMTSDVYARAIETGTDYVWGTLALHRYPNYMSGEHNFYVGGVFTVNAANSADVEYTNEYYLYNSESGEYELAEAETETAVAEIGSIVSFNAKEIAGYVYDDANENNVSSAAIYAGSTVTLKGYYLPVMSVDLSVDSETGAAVLRKDATLNFGNIGDVKRYTVTQYVVNTSSVTNTVADSTLNTFTETPTAWTKTGVDVTEDYQGLFTGTVLDTSKFDGIYTVTAFGTLGVKEITFEQVQDGVFTWNNIDENGKDTLVGSELVGRYSKTEYTGTAVLSSENSATDARLASKAGLYWKAAGAKKTEFDTLKDNGRPYIRVFPVHSYDYYEQWFGSTISIDIYYTNADGEAGVDFTSATFAYVKDDTLNKDTGKYILNTGLAYPGDCVWTTYSITFGLNQYVRASALKTSGVRGYGSFFGVDRWADKATCTALDLYVGNIRAAFPTA